MGKLFFAVVAFAATADAFLTAALAPRAYAARCTAVVMQRNAPRKTRTDVRQAAKAAKAKMEEDARMKAETEAMIKDVAEWTKDTGLAIGKASLEFGADAAKVGGEWLSDALHNAAEAAKAEVKAAPDKMKRAAQAKAAEDIEYVKATPGRLADAAQAKAVEDIEYVKATPGRLADAAAAEARKLAEEVKAAPGKLAAEVKAAPEKLAAEAKLAPAKMRDSIKAGFNKALGDSNLW